MCLSQGGSLAWVPRVRLRSASAVTTGHFPISRHARAGTATAYAMPPLTRSTFGYAGGSAQPIGMVADLGHDLAAAAQDDEVATLAEQQQQQQQQRDEGRAEPPRTPKPPSPAAIEIQKQLKAVEAVLCRTVCVVC